MSTWRPNRLVLLAPLALAAACTGLLSGTDTLPVSDSGATEGGDAQGDRTVAGGEGGESGAGGDAGDAGADGGGTGDAAGHLDASHDASPDASSDAPTDADASPESGGTSVVALSSWYFHACALLSNGRVTCWGDDEQSALGDGTNTYALPPTPVRLTDGGPLEGVQQIAVGWEHACALQSGGTVLCWGDRNWGETGVPPTGSAQGFPDPGLAVPGTFTAIAAKGWNGSGIEPWGGFSCAIDPEKSVWCWGSNDDDGLGHAQGTAGDISYYDNAASREIVLNSMPVAVGGLSDVQQLALHDGGGCALTGAGTVLCWGWNLHGQVANGSTTDSPQAMPAELAPGQPITGVRKIAGGHDAVCALLTTGALWCWGRNDNYSFALGRDAGFSMATPPTLWNAGAFGPVSDVVIGQRHVCVVRASDSTVWCAGWNAEFQLGTGSATGDPDASDCPPCVASPLQVLGPGGTGFLSGVLELSAGWASTCARTASGVYCWGYDGYGQTGHAPGALAVDRPCAGSYCTPFPMPVPGL